MRLKIVAAFALLYNLPLGAMDHTFRTQSEVEAEPFNFPGLPSDVQRIIQMMALKNIPARCREETGNNLAQYAGINKSFNAFINKPANMKLLIDSMARYVRHNNEFDLARGFRNMPGVKSKEVQEWLALRKQQIPLEEQLRLNVRAGSIENIEALITAGVDINAQSDFLGTTSLMCALNAHVPLVYVQKLLALGASVHLKDKDGSTALIAGVAHGSIENVIEILKHRPNVNHINDSGRTALMMAVQRRHAKEFVGELVGAGADVNLKGKKGRTALIHTADDYTILEAIEALLQYDADVNIQDDEGETALMKSIRVVPGCLHGAQPVIQALLAAKGDLRIPNKKGQTALDIVRMNAQDYLQKGKKIEFGVCRKIAALIEQRLQWQNSDNGIDFSIYC